ncbi:MAG: hypothetical protein Kow0069_14270 [Promethearchaeota archaeon]
MTIFRLHFPGPTSEATCARLGRLVWDLILEHFPGQEDRVFGHVERAPLHLRVVKAGGHLGYLAAEVELSVDAGDAELEAFEKDLAGLLTSGCSLPENAVLLKVVAGGVTRWSQGDGKCYHAVSSPGGGSGRGDGREPVLSAGRAGTPRG